MNKILKIVLISLIVIVSAVFIFLLKDDIFPQLTFKLNGDSYVSHNLFDEYHDLGFVAKYGKKDLSNEVVVDNKVNVEKEGIYTVTYTYNNEVLTRQVEVKKINSFKLLGDREVYLLLNGEYSDPKVEAISGEKDYLNEVIINNEVDVTKTGNYKITYSFNRIGKTLERNIHVSDFSEFFNVNYDNKTIEKLSLQISIDQDKISKYILPDGKERNANDTFIVDKNGEYTFVIYDKYNNKYDKKINIENVKVINPITATCNATIKNGKTTISVTANKSISKYVYNGVESKNNSYVINSESENNKVVLYDNDNQTKEINCNTKREYGKLEIHFINSCYYDDAILIRSDNTTIFIDGGRGDEAVKKYLKGLNVKTIDYLIGSHMDYDHIGAHKTIVQYFKVKNVIYPDDIYTCSNGRCDRQQLGSVRSAFNSKKITAKVQKVPSTLKLTDMKLYFIAPWQIINNANNNSFIFILEFGNNKFMFTGDSDSPLSKVSTLTSYAKKLGLSNIKVDMVKYPHHGNQWLTQDFINATNPRYFVVPNIKTADKPNTTFRSDMKKRGIKVYRQSDSKTGNILITSDGIDIKFKMDVYDNLVYNKDNCKPQ